VANVSSPAETQLQCTFLSGFTGSAHCRVQYGTDPTYMNLPYSAESDEAGTAGETVSVVLREQLNSSSVYYYAVSIVGGGVTVAVQGSFTTPQQSKQIHKVWTNTRPRYILNGFFFWFLFFVFCFCLPPDCNQSRTGWWWTRYHRNKCWTLTINYLRSPLFIPSQQAVPWVPCGGQALFQVIIVIPTVNTTRIMWLPFPSSMVK